jgi:nickel superoxide dismutase
MNHKSNQFFVITFLLVSLFWTTSIFAHCEIPCGIYNDKMRIDMIKEHITTIEKSMNQIVELSKQTSINYNQLVRWITNKEDHANQLQQIVTQYFMTQRVKPVDMSDKDAYGVYQQQLELLHHMLVFAMKAKQTTDLANIEKLRELVSQFYEIYFGEKDNEHLEEHH